MHHHHHTHWPPSVCSALEVPVLYPVHVGPAGPPECPPPLPGGNLTARVAPSGRGELCQCMSGVPPLDSTFGLFPILVKCDYQFILIQLCLSHYLWLSCVFIVLSIQYDFVWSTRYSPVFLLVSALPCHALPCFSTLNAIILSYILISMFLVHPSCVHCDSFE